MCGPQKSSAGQFPEALPSKVSPHSVTAGPQLLTQGLWRTFQTHYIASTLRHSIRNAADDVTLVGVTTTDAY